MAELERSTKVFRTEVKSSLIGGINIDSKGMKLKFLFHIAHLIEKVQQNLADRYKQNLQISVNRKEPMVGNETPL